MPNPVDSYKKTKIETADPVRLVIMCYDAVINDLKDAKKYQREKNLEATYDKVRHAQDIITELLVGLDYEKGGDIAVNLGRLYNYILRHLIAVNSRSGPDYYDPLIKIMEELREAWQEISKSSTSPPPNMQGSIVG